MVFCPLVGLLMLAVIAWLTVSGLKLRALARAPAVACPSCGHFLAPEQQTCPECGTSCTPEQLSALLNARFRSWQIRLAVAVALALAILLIAVAALVPLLDYVNQANSRGANSPSATGVAPSTPQPAPATTP